MAEIIDLEAEELAGKKRKVRKCLNPECDCRLISNLVKASLQVKRFYGVESYPKKTRVCYECCAAANVNTKIVVQSVRDKRLIFNNPLTVKKSALIVSDSDSDPSEDEKDSADNVSDIEIDLSEFAEYTKPELADTKAILSDIIAGVSNDLGLHLQVDTGVKEMTDRLKTGQKEFDALSLEFASLESKLDNIRNKFYDTCRESCYYLPDLNFGDTEENADVTEIQPVQSNTVVMPPKGVLERPSLKVGESVLAMYNNLTSRWLPATVTGRPVLENNSNAYQIQFKHLLGTGKEGTTKKYGCHLAYENMCSVLIPVGTRIVAKYSEDSATRLTSLFYVGIVAESPTAANKYRYLIFFDDGYAQYVNFTDVRVVVETSSQVWEDVAPESRDFIKDYIQRYPERPMVRLQKFNYIKTEYCGRWRKAQVVELDASLAKMEFPLANRTEWIYRGSTRLSPLYEKKMSMQVKNEQPNSVVRRRTVPYKSRAVVEYINDGEVQDVRPTPGVERRAVARKSTSGRAGTPPLEVQRKIVQEGKGILNRVKFGDRLPVFRPHQCSKVCVKDENTMQFSQCAPIMKPLYLNWRRHISKVRKKSSVMKRVITYGAPCGRKLRSIEEVLLYLRSTKSKLEIDFFSFEIGVDATADWVPETKKLFIEDITHGVEEISISCVNSLGFEEPSHLIYCSVREPIENVNINTNPQFLVCCSCEDDCQDKTRCECWQLTFENMVVNGQTGAEVGYSYRRLHDQVPTGIYECNSQCRCKSSCLNRVVQHPIRQRLQLFKTAKRGWGVRTLHDIPKGSFITVYVGKVLSESVANEEGKLTTGGDDYYAELDFIEVAESTKEGYESDVEMPSDSEEGKKVASKEPSVSSHSDLEDEPIISNTTHKYDTDRDYEGLGRLLEKKLVEQRKPSERIKARASRTGSSDTRNSDETSESSENDRPQRPSQAFEPVNAPSMKKQTGKNVRSLYGDNECVYIMDAKVRGNIGRYFNHSCMPNIFVQNVFVDTHDMRFPWVAFFAAMNIKAGTELTWDYNYEVGSVPGKIKYCYCMTKYCRGRLL